MKQLYYGLWKLIIILPLPLRVLVEIVTAMLLLAIIWPIAKRVLGFLLKVLMLVNRGFWGGVRYVICFVAQKNVKVYEWDEQIGKQGSRSNSWLQARVENLSRSRGRNIFKKKRILIMLFILYLVVILPSFRLERFLSEYYLEYIYFVNSKYMDVESKLSEGIESYPDLFIPPEVTEVVAMEDKTDPIQETIYLVLKKDISFANVREEANIDSESICVVSSEDQIAYQNVYEHDGSRYWLKVIVETKDGREGWISGKIIEQEILDLLDLQ